mmetsp:Transcript_115302/g.288082  ORF Transcript_115302/g.288082 Transcript_115302/m.288082 type:complete len:422 (-) Transcript_115302:1831-3096(-)
MELLCRHGRRCLPVTRHELPDAGEVWVTLLMELLEDSRILLPLLRRSVRNVIVALPLEALSFSLQVVQFVAILLLARRVHATTRATLTAASQDLECPAEELVVGQVSAPNRSAADLFKASSLFCRSRNHPRRAVTVHFIRELGIVLDVGERLRVRIQGASHNPAAAAMEQEGSLDTLGSQSLVRRPSFERLVQAHVGANAVNWERTLQCRTLLTLAVADAGEGRLEALASSCTLPEPFRHEALTFLCVGTPPRQRGRCAQFGLLLAEATLLGFALFCEESLVQHSHVPETTFRRELMRPVRRREDDQILTFHPVENLQPPRWRHAVLRSEIALLTRRQPRRRLRYRLVAMGFPKGSEGGRGVPMAFILRTGEGYVLSARHAVESLVIQLEEFQECPLRIFGCCLIETASTEVLPEGGGNSM